MSAVSSACYSTTIATNSHMKPECRGQDWVDGACLHEHDRNGVKPVRTSLEEGLQKHVVFTIMDRRTHPNINPFAAGIGTRF